MARTELLEEYWPVLLGAAAVLGGAVWYARSRQLSTEQRAIVLPSPQVDVGAIVNAQAQMAMAAEQARAQLFRDILAGAIKEEELASQERVATLQAQYAVQVAQLQADLERRRIDAQLEAARLQAQAQMEAAARQAAAQQQQATLGFLGGILGAIIPFIFSVERTRAFAKRRAALNRRMAAAYPWAFQGVH